MAGEWLIAYLMDWFWLTLIHMLDNPKPCYPSYIDDKCVHICIMYTWLLIKKLCLSEETSFDDMISMVDLL
jgi:hypothetical protein